MAIRIYRDGQAVDIEDMKAEIRRLADQGLLRTSYRYHMHCLEDVWDNILVQRGSKQALDSFISNVLS